jgi:hypothetical protein
VSMDKYVKFAEVQSALVQSSFLARKTEEGALILAVVCQGVKDAMGLYGSADEKVYLEGVNRQKREFISKQEDAIRWFRSKGHYPFCARIQLRCGLVDHLLTEQCGVKL